MLGSSEFVIRDLLESHHLDEVGVERAKSHAAAESIDVLEAIVQLGVTTSRVVAIARSGICECSFVDLDAYDVHLGNARLLPRAVAEKHTVFPLFVIDDVATVGMADPMNLRAVDELHQLLKLEIDVVLCEQDLLTRLISTAYSMAPTDASLNERAEAGDEANAELTTGQEPIVAAMNHIIARAIEENASDVHINPDESELRIRYRIDGVLQVRQGPSLAAHSALVQRLKVMSKLDLTQSRRPQDGKFRFDHLGRLYDIRLSTIPTVCGENVVLRILAPSSTIKGFEALGLPPHVCESFRDVVKRPHGMILVTGPTGSGKTTTLYTALSTLNTADRNIMTIEDPVEIRLPMVRQTQVNAEIGMTFANALRSILRQDPDVILVGEIRDEETAQIAVQSALTGHLVFATLHTNDAVGAVSRLKDLGLPPFAINSALLCVMAQRLVRRVCEHCSAPLDADDAMLAAYGLDRDSSQGLVRGVGCPKCMDTGYRGRVGLYELLTMSPRIESLIEAGASSRQIAQEASEEGMKRMWEDGLDKARLGVTTLEELAKVRVSDEMRLEHAEKTARLCA